MRRRRLRNAPRRQTDWISFIEQDTFASVTEAFALIDDQDLVDKDGKLTVERIVGEVLLVPIDAGGGATSTLAWEGIIVSDLDNAGLVTPWDPADGIDAEGPWLWRRVRQVGVALAGATPVNTLAFELETNHIDVSARRKMHERQDLLYVVRFQGSIITGQPAATGFNIVMNLRTLVKLT